MENKWIQGRNPYTNYGWIENERITQPPLWCSSDLRDIDATLLEPLTMTERITFLELLLQAGFQSIHLGDGSSKETTELLQWILRHEETKETIFVLDGTPGTLESPLVQQMKEKRWQIVYDFGCPKVLLASQKKPCRGGSILFSIPEFAKEDMGDVLAICNRAIRALKPEPTQEIILSLPISHQVMPHVFGGEVAYLKEHLAYSSRVTLGVYSNHPHESDEIYISYGILAGAKRLETKFFGRDDLLRYALEIQQQTSVPGLKPANVPEIKMTYEHLTGKRNIESILRQHCGIILPEEMKGEVEGVIKKAYEEQQGELSPSWVFHIFEEYFVTPQNHFRIENLTFKNGNGVLASFDLVLEKKRQPMLSAGSGHLDAVSNGIVQYFGIQYDIQYYEEHALSAGSSAKVICCVGIVSKGRVLWGAGIDVDMIKASVEALCVAVNQMEELKSTKGCQDPRILEILGCIQEDYLHVSLKSLSERFYLSEPYLSKYIKDRTGKTFGEIMKEVRMKKARSLLKSSTMTVEGIAKAVGYQNVEHFNRLFKKTYHMTPMQYRNHG